MNDKNTEILNDFGKLLIEKVYDTVYRHFLITIDGKFKSAESKKLTNDLKIFPPEQLALVKEIVLSTLDSSLHYFLWMIEQSDDFDLVAITDDKSVSLKELTYGIFCGEPQGEDGWIAKYSKYYSPPAVIVEHFEPRGPLWEYLQHNYYKFLTAHNLYDGLMELGEKEAERIAQAYPKELYINRCPKCNFIKKTPRASLCLGCGDFSSPIVKEEN